MTDGYNESYGSGEIAEVTIDMIVGVGAALVSFVTIIGLILLYGWIRRQM